MRGHIYFYTHLSVPFGVAASVLAGDPALWLPAPAERSNGHFAVTLTAEGALPGPVAEHTADVEIGPSGRYPESLIRSVTWRSAHLDRILPTLAADLELCTLGGGGSQLSMTGTYKPPLSVVGEVGDRLHGHRIAEACVRRFVLDVGMRLEAATLPA
jgi:hypothetical protein